MKKTKIKTLVALSCLLCAVIDANANCVQQRSPSCKYSIGSIIKNTNINYAELIPVNIESITKAPVAPIIQMQVQEQLQVIKPNFSEIASREIRRISDFATERERLQREGAATITNPTEEYGAIMPQFTQMQQNYRFELQNMAREFDFSLESGASYDELLEEATNHFVMVQQMQPAVSFNENMQQNSAAIFLLFNAYSGTNGPFALETVKKANKIFAVTSCISMCHRFDVAQQSEVDITTAALIMPKELPTAQDVKALPKFYTAIVPVLRGAIQNLQPQQPPMQIQQTDFKTSIMIKRLTVLLGIIEKELV